MGFMPGMPGLPPQPPLAPAPPILEPVSVEDEPPNKKLRNEDNLLSESEFLALNNVRKYFISISLPIPSLFFYFF